MASSIGVFRKRFNYPSARPLLLVLFPSGGTMAVTGSITPSSTETDITTGSKQVVLTLTGDTFVSA